MFDLDIKVKVKAKNYILSLCKLDFSSFHMLILYTKINIEILHNLKKKPTGPCFNRDNYANIKGSINY